METKNKTETFVDELVKILNRQYGHTGAHFDGIVRTFVEAALKKAGCVIRAGGDAGPQRR